MLRKEYRVTIETRVSYTVTVRAMDEIEAEQEAWEAGTDVEVLGDVTNCEFKQTVTRIDLAKGDSNE